MKTETTSPKMYLSTNGGQWRVIYQGMPLCKDFDNAQDALRVYDQFVRQVYTIQPAVIAVWDGDLGLFR